MNRQISRLYKGCKFILTVTIILVIFNAVSQFWGELKTSSYISVYLIELPIVLIITKVFYFPKIPNRFTKYFFSILPVFFIYISIDIFYSFLQRSPRISDFNNFFSIFNFSIIYFITIILSFLLLCGSMFYLFISAKKAYHDRSFIISVAVRVLALLLLIFMLYSNHFSNATYGIFKIYSWSDKTTIKRNGRINSFVQLSLLEKKNKITLAKQHNNKIDIQKHLFGHTLINKRNVHIIVLESFINPNYLQNVEYNKEPTHPGLKKYLVKNKFSNIISPVYGGSTAQAEFEILTGIKAYGKIQSIEFNVMKGGRIQALVEQLNKNNYKTIATIATDASYFNSKLAYKSLGFNQIEFLENSPYFKKNKKDIKIFDADIFEYNLNTLKNHFKDNNYPIFNYVLGIYGHLPYDRNLQTRPDVITLKNNTNINIKNITNQFYYRTGALASFLEKLILLDPDAIIFITSDHLPPILNKNILYKFDNKVNIALLLDKGNVVDITGKKQYEIPHKIWDTLTEKRQNRDNGKMEQLYYKALYQSTQVN
jgi:phosphoglycerol transferase MdoB-like AlkP superfamily enzyme